MLIMEGRDMLTASFAVFGLLVVGIVSSIVLITR